MVSTVYLGKYKQVVYVKDLKHTKKINAKPKIFVVLEEGLLFLSDGATVAVEDRFVAEPTEAVAVL